jgi:hypothetical protein
MLAGWDELEIPFCYLTTHSASGIIIAGMLLQQPRRFGRVLALDVDVKSTPSRSGCRAR